MKRDALATSAVQPAAKRQRRQLHELDAAASTPKVPTTCTSTHTTTFDDSVPASMPFCPPDDMPCCPPDHVEPVEPSPLAAPTPESTSLYCMSCVTPELVVAATPFPTSATVTEKCKACVEKSKKCSTLRKGNLRLNRRVAELKQTIRELESVSSHYAVCCFKFVIDFLLFDYFPRGICSVYMEI